MFCNKCGDPIEENEMFCNKCGNPLNNTQNSLNGPIISSPNYSMPANNMVGNNNKKKVYLGIGIGIGIFLFFFFISLTVDLTSRKYYFNPDPNESNNGIQSPGSSTKKSKYDTVIVYDNTYSGVTIKKEKDAFKLIEKDSVDQKSKCPNEIKKIEDDLIKNYGITAVNLCELDISYAKEIGKVFKKIYDEYPSVRGYITNLTLVNAPMSQSYIAAFMPIFQFASSDTSSTYPWVIKTQVLLNTTYFLNLERLQTAVTDSSLSGHFPKNATVYSPVAHELGHYLSFLALMKNYEIDSILLLDSDNVDIVSNMYADFGKGSYSLSMITEAYNNYKNDTNTTMSIDEWRGTISEYALAKNNNGEYIYDETIAESFHDVYLNGNNACDASKYVVSVLKGKLEG